MESLAETDAKEAEVQAELPLQWALSFAWHHKYILLLLGLVPLMLELGITLFTYSRSVEPKDLFLVFLVKLLAKAWFVTVVSIFLVDKLKATQERLVELAFRALRLMPKVLLSLFVLITLIYFSVVSLLPAVVFLVFLLWAPLFCAFDLWSPAVRAADTDGEEGGFSFFDDEAWDEDETLQAGPPQFFRRIAFWHLGFSRSVLLASQYLSASFKVLVLYWILWVVPLAGVHLLSRDGTALSTQMLVALVTFFFYPLWTGVWVAVFWRILPLDARTDLGIEGSDPEYPAPSWLRHFDRKNAALVFGSMLALAATLFIERQRVQWMQMPESVTHHLSAVVFENEEVVLELNLEDADRGLRWLQADGFRLKLSGLEEKQKPKPEQAENSSLPEGLKEAVDELKEAKEGLLLAKNVKMYDAGGKLISSGASLAFGSQARVRLVLRFEAPQGLSENSGFEIYYLGHESLDKLLIASGKFNDAWWSRRSELQT